MQATKTNTIIDRAITEAQARAELNATMLKLRTKYGYAPVKGVSYEEMDQRCKDLVSATRTAVKAYVRATGKAPDRMKTNAKYEVSKDFPRKKYEGLQAYANVPDAQVKKAPLHTAEAIGNLLNFNADYLLKAAHEQAVKNRTRKEWMRAEYEYVEKSDYNLRDLFDDLIKRFEDTVDPITLEEWRQERRKWKSCLYYSCDNVFPIAKDHNKSHAFKWSGIKYRRSDAKYCCDGCKKAQENALDRFNKTGTYLPEYVYEYILDDAREKKARNEVATEQEKMNNIADI